MDLNQCFEHFDSGKKGMKHNDFNTGVIQPELGYLNKEDVQMAIVGVLGFKPSKIVLMQLFPDQCSKEFIGSVSSIRICRESFCSAMQKRFERMDETQHLRKAFKALDSKYIGFITAHDFVQLSQEIAPHLPQSLVHQIFQELDRNGDAKLSFRDFEQHLCNTRRIKL